MITFIFYLNVTDALIIPFIFIFFYLFVNRLIIATNFVERIKNLVVNHKSQPVKLNTDTFFIEHLWWLLLKSFFLTF